MPRKATKKLMLSLSVAAALGCGAGSAFADGDPVEALEARIAELEAMVKQLMEERRAPPPPADSAAVEARAAAAAEERVNAMLAERQAEEEEAGKKHSYAFGGFIKTDVIVSQYDDGSYEGAGRDFYIPSTVPVGGLGETYTDFHAKESRINFKSNHLLDSGAKVGTFFEMDFQLSSQGDERISNSESTRVRHAFLTYNNWLVGQTWQTFFNVGALAENLDFVGPAENLFGRQPMIRYTTGPWMFAIENPETTLSPYQGGGRIVTDDTKMPDLVARYNGSGDWGSFSVAAILRDLRYEDRSIGGVHDSTNSWGLSFSGKMMVGDRDDFRWMITTGEGLGRYLGLNIAPGAVIDANGELEAIDSTAVSGSYRHFWNDKWRSNLTLSYIGIDNDVALTGLGASKKASSVHANVIYSPIPKLDFGLELLLAEREIESGVDGSLTRLQFSAKYAY